METPETRQFRPIATTDQSTVVAEYTPPESTAGSYQSEAELERELIRILQTQAYEYLSLHTESELKANLRTRLEALNEIKFSDHEWDRFFNTKISGANDSIADKTRRIQIDNVQVLQRDDGTDKNIKLIDKTNIHRNSLQVINQYEADQATGARHDNRYDVTILVNGLPMVHIELKRRGVDIREAFNQIKRYQRDSFWAGSGLFDYVQLFVISNGTLTKYYSNTTREHHITETTTGTPSKRRTSNSYEFTSWWADAQNKPIRELTAFARTFLARHALLNILIRYCVLAENGDLLVMRPYQIVATERILQKIQVATNHGLLGTVNAGGYVWHTTGSGKTLTSFKTAQLASADPNIDRVLFVVDRKDLDYQTMREYDRFQEGAANSNTSTKILKEQLEDSDARIIITTIQKLSTFIKANPVHQVYHKHVVMIFDECHRSQFGDMHRLITRAFKRYNIFGFTGTPIFASKTADTNTRPETRGTVLRTTEQTFGDKLHTYTILDAINDGNVLQFKVEYINTIRQGQVTDGEVMSIDKEAALLDETRIANIVSYTLDHFAQKTQRTDSYMANVVRNVAESTRRRRPEDAQVIKQRVRGFNAIFATASIEAARIYYNQFQLQQDERIADGKIRSDERLKVGIIYSYGANEADPADGQLPDESFNTTELGTDARSFLEDAIADYNDMFGTSYDTSGEKFENYYKDMAQRLKNRELDLVIVVNMFLTGFDAPTLNTLFVDKNLRTHGLLQAFSRTNRILNSVKTHGNIVCFRNLVEATEEALELFGNKDAAGIVLLRPFEEYMGEYRGAVGQLQRDFPIDIRIESEAAQAVFVKLFSQILRLENILGSFDQFDPDVLLSDRQRQDYRSIYLDIHARRRERQESQKEYINDDLVFEIELIKQVEVTVDYILMLVEESRKRNGNGQNVELSKTIQRMVDSSPSLRNKKDLIEQFIEEQSVDTDTEIDQQWRRYISRKRDEELEQIITEEQLQPEPTREFVKRAFQLGELRTTGMGIVNLLRPRSRFGTVQPGQETLGEAKARLIQRMGAFFERFKDLVNAEDTTQV